MNELFEELLARVRACEICAAELPLGPRPVVRGTPEARILLIGQAGLENLTANERQPSRRPDQTRDFSGTPADRR